MMDNECREFRAGDDANGLTIERSKSTSVIHVVGRGFWTPAVMDAHFGQLQTSVAPARKAGLGVRMIVDLRGSDVQSPQTIDRMKVGAAGVTQQGDRMAIIVGSSLAKIQMRRTIGDAQHEFFLSPEAAMKWVEAY